MTTPADTGATISDHILVRCPKCAACATIDAQHGSTRITCSSCGLAKQMSSGRLSSRSGALTVVNAHRQGWLRDWQRVYNGADRPFDANLWLETECCGGKRLWALNAAHLEYIEAFVGSTERTREFPSPPGHRQLGDKLPAWMTQRKHRDEVLRAISRLRATI